MHIPNATKPFLNTLDAALAKYERSRSSVEQALASLASDSGLAYPGFSPLNVRKVRIPLPEYRISQSGGLRLIFLATKGGAIVPIYLYKKGNPPQEHKIAKRVRELLPDIIDALPLSPRPDGP